MFSKLFKSEGGFTLVELLVTIAILGVLFGIVTLTLSGVGTNAEATVKIAECAVVQSAADIWLAANPGSLLTAVSPAEILDGPEVEFTIYLRDLPTAYTYSVTPAGEVTCP